MKKIVFAILLGITASCSHLDKKPKVAFVSTHIDYASYEFQEAANSLKKELTVHAFSPSTEGELPPFNVKDLASYDLVLFEGLGARISLLQPQIDSIKKLTRVGFIRMDQAEGNLKKDIQKTMDSYWENGNIENYKGLFSFLAKELFGLNMPVPKPIVFPPYGYYHPDHEGLSPSLGTYLSWYESRKTAHQVKDASTIGLIYYQSNYVKKDMQAVDALIRNIESKGHRVVPLLGKGSFQVDSFFLKDQQPVVDVIIYGGMFLDFRNPERGIASAKKLNVPILGGIINSYKNIEAWENDIGGLAPEMTDRFYFTEKDGVFEPIVIGGTATSSNGQKKSTPISYQIDWRVDRALAWAKLRKTDNADKKILVTYYNEGGGKANIGADPDAYLNAPASLSNLLKAWKQEGYSTGDKPLPSGEQLTRQMVEYGSNVKTWSSQELEKRKRGARLIRIPKEKYLSWFNDYPKEQQLEVIRKWGTPPGRLMVQTDSTGKESIVIPLLEFGNIVFAPHPSWGLHNDPELIYANDPLPPNHAYIAFFEWMKREFKPHAYFSLFTQLSLMPGKLEGPSANDWVGKLIGSVPHINAAPLIAGASVGNKRRANALTIGHTTDIALAGISDSLKMVLRHIEDWKTATNPAVRGKLADKILQAAQAEGLNAVLNKNAEKPIPIYFNELERYIIDISLQKVPQGSHVLGEAPSGTKRESMIEAMLGSDFTGEERKQKALEYDSLLNLAPMEIEGLMKAFRGEYVESGPSGDPVRSPESLPAGRNPHPSNEKNIPTREAWEIGKKMADQLLVQHEKKHGPGSFPKKVAFVLWSSEITHSQGVLEAEILY
ncbi:MAG: cobaltochelatase subunit CobN, partial [Anditalea sp.]